MSKYLRDERIKNLTLGFDAIKSINDDLLEIAGKYNASLGDRNLSKEELGKEIMIPHYIIRFDQKGYNLFDFNQVSKHFNDAHKVERFIFILDSINSINRFNGKVINLNLDAKDINNCSITIQDDDIDWVEQVFHKLQERLNKYKNNNHFARNRWTPFVIQMTGVILMVLGSFIIAYKIAPRLAIENSFAFAFIISIIVLSNIWALILEFLLKAVDYFWPNVAFNESNKLDWLVKAFISTIFVSFFIALFAKFFNYVSNMFRGIIK
jgi:hypothetical protein